MKSAYCPICDETIIVLTPEWIIHCPKCGNHLNLQFYSEEDADEC